MHYFVTGHTGFKGAWLCYLLLNKGHEVSGYALDPEPNSLYAETRISQELKSDYRADIRNIDTLQKAIQESNPDHVIHMAAQPLVREGYRDPVATFEINVTGTLNLLQATRQNSSIRSQVIVTTDKVYKNRNQREGYVESDELGGDDPYSASKAMADILTQSWIKSFSGIPTGIARAGNVIGGGDTSKDRLFPDLIRSYKDGLPAELRFPNAVRPWQHVLDCLNGYLLLCEALERGIKGIAWNFGPAEDEFIEVKQVAEIVADLWRVSPAWKEQEGEHPHEANFLALNSDKARIELGWAEKYKFIEGVTRTSQWYSKVESGMTKEEATLLEIQDFLAN